MSRCVTLAAVRLVPAEESHWLTNDDTSSFKIGASSFDLLETSTVRVPACTLLSKSKSS